MSNLERPRLTLLCASLLTSVSCTQGFDPNRGLCRPHPFFQALGDHSDLVCCLNRRLWHEFGLALARRLFHVVYFFANFSILMNKRQVKWRWQNKFGSFPPMRRSISKQIYKLIIAKSASTSITIIWTYSTATFCECSILHVWNCFLTSNLRWPEDHGTDMWAVGGLKLVGLRGGRWATSDKWCYVQLTV